MESFYTIVGFSTKMSKMIPNTWRKLFFNQVFSKYDINDLHFEILGVRDFIMFIELEDFILFC